MSKPAVYTSIRYDPDEHQYLYRYLEPRLSEFEQSVYDDLLPTVRRVLLDEEFERTEAGTEAFEARLHELLGEYTTALDPLARWKLLYYFRRDFVGFEALDPLMGDPHIEETREIELPHENWIADLTREQSIHGEQPETGMYELLDEALHQRPDYLLVDEIRTGHEGFTTFHADSSQDTVRRRSHDPSTSPSNSSVTPTSSPSSTASNSRARTPGDAGS